MPVTRDVRSFHPDLRTVARVLPRAVVTPRTLRVARLAFGATRWRPGRGVVTSAVSEHASVRVFRPRSGSDGGSRPALLWVHGGGYVIGCAAQDDALCRSLARGLGIVVASVDYRLAPEHPHPAALDDCFAALQWLGSEAGVDASRIAVGGASAGGGLAAALAQRARGEGDVRPVFQLLTYPMVDDRTALVRPVQDDRDMRAWNPTANALGWGCLLAGADPVPPFAAAARTEDLTGLPPAWIGVGTLDLFLEEDTAYAERLRGAGVACELHVVQGAFHGFDVLAPWAGVTRSFAAERARALRAGLLG